MNKRDTHGILGGPVSAPRPIRTAHVVMREKIPLRTMEHMLGEHMILKMADIPHRSPNEQRRRNQRLLAAARSLRHRKANRLHRALQTIHMMGIREG